MATAKCLFAAALKVDRDHPCGMHTHICTEIVYCQGCRGWFPHDHQRFRYRDGTVAVYQPPSRHANESETSGLHVSIGVEGCGAEQLPVGVWQSDDAVKEAVLHIQYELQSPAPQHQEKLDLFCGWLVLELRRMITGEPPRKRNDPPSPHVDAAKAIFDTRFNEPLTIRDVAANLSIHPDYLRQMFKQQVGESPMHYLIHKRIDCACELLKITDLSIKEIAARTGLENPYYFSRLFKGRMKLSPSDYRARHR